MNILHYYLLLLLLLLISTLLSSTPLVLSTTHPDDIRNLKTLKTAVNPNSIRTGSCLRSWNFTFDPCDSIFTQHFTCGLRCDLIEFDLSRVTEITLDQAGYTGSLSASFDLPYLEILDLSYNNFSGSIPGSLISNLTLLRRLSLSKNSFGGSIPGSIGSLARLQELYLDNNRFTGSIPRSFNYLFSLKRLELQQNLLSGELPNLRNLMNLYFFDLSDNFVRFGSSYSSVNLDRDLPSSLVQLSIRNSSLKGGLIFDRVKSMRHLQVLDMSYNELTGTIPSSFFCHVSLQQVTLSHNEFELLQETRGMTGSNCMHMGYIKSGLVAVDLSYNQLHGLLPVFMALIPRLSALSLEHNRFNGTIPAQYAAKAAGIRLIGTASFGRLLLGWNYLSGPIPKDLMGLRNTSVDLSLVGNCLYSCPDQYYFCKGGSQRSLVECKDFGIEQGLLRP